MLVGETNSSEASSFLSALISAEVLFSSVGWILLLALIQILIAIFRKQLIKLYVFIITVLELASVKKRLMAIQMCIRDRLILVLLDNRSQPMAVVMQEDADDGESSQGIACRA